MNAYRNASCSGSLSGMSLTFFPKPPEENRHEYGSLFIWMVMWLSFQQTTAGISTAGLESGLLRSRFLRLCWVGRGTKTHIRKNLSEELHVLSFSLERNSNLCLPWFWKGSLCKSCMWTWVSAHALLILGQEYLFLPVSKLKITHLKYLEIYFF